MNIWTLPLKNVRNNRLRSALVLLGVATAVFVFCFFESVQLTMASVVDQASRNNNLVAIKEHTWWPTESDIPDQYARDFASQPQVEDAMPIYIASTSCWNFEPETVVIHGVDKTKFQRFRPYQVIEGSLDDFNNARDAAFVGASLAKRKGWKVGQTVDLSAQLGLLFKVAGICATGSEEQDNLVLMDIGYVQDRFDARGHANLIVAKLRGSARAEDVAESLDRLPKAVGTRTQAETAFLSGMIDDLSDMIAISRIVILITLAVVLASVANAVSMNVRERTRQIGIMRTLGFGRARVLALVLGEAALVCLAGGMLGALAAWGTMRFSEFTMQARNLNLSVSMPATVVAWAALLALGVGLLGGAWPAWRASRQGIVAALGSLE